MSCYPIKEMLCATYIHRKCHKAQTVPQKRFKVIDGKYFISQLSFIIQRPKTEGLFVGQSSICLSDFLRLNSYVILNMSNQRSIAHFVLSKWLSASCVRLYFSAKSQLV